MNYNLWSETKPKILLKISTESKERIFHIWVTALKINVILSNPLLSAKLKSLEFANITASVVNKVNENKRIKLLKKIVILSVSSSFIKSTKTKVTIAPLDWFQNNINNAKEKKRVKVKALKLRSLRKYNIINIRNTA